MITKNLYRYHLLSRLVYKSKAIHRLMIYSQQYLYRYCGPAYKMLKLFVI